MFIQRSSLSHPPPPHTYCVCTNAHVNLQFMSACCACGCGIGNRHLVTVENVLWLNLAATVHLIWIILQVKTYALRRGSTIVSHAMDPLPHATTCIGYVESSYTAKNNINRFISVHNSTSTSFISCLLLLNCKMCILAPPYCLSLNVALQASCFLKCLPLCCFSFRPQMSLW